jgi:uncharacterized membrane protein YhhN
MLFLVFYGLAAFANIFAIRLEKHFIRLVSKICLMPLLMLLYISKSGALSFSVIVAIIFSWCGDILLVNPRKFTLCAGIAGFLAAHILYIIAFIDLTPKVNVMAFVFSFLFILAIECFLALKSPVLTSNKFLIIVYGIVISLLIVSALQVFMWHKNAFSIVLVIGSILFFISDAVLGYFNTIKTMTKNALTVVMVSYSVAQACLVIGYMNIHIIN